MNIKYLPSMADISFKKQYPKQNKTFHVYAIEADKTFHKEYRLKKGITLVPYAAWVKNETLTFEIHRDPREQVEVKRRGMGRIQPLQSLRKEFNGEVEKIQGVDFANWLKKTISKNDFAVMKMDVEGTEFDLIPRLFEISLGTKNFVAEFFITLNQSLNPPVLVFVQSKERAKELYGELAFDNIRVDVIHYDLSQEEMELHSCCSFVFPGALKIERVEEFPSECFVF